MSILPSRRSFDQWFPTVVRYVGIISFVYAVAIDRGKNPALIPAATGLIFLKTVYGGSKE